jgi:hypothetical protein
MQLIQDIVPFLSCWKLMFHKHNAELTVKVMQYEGLKGLYTQSYLSAIGA